MIDRLESGNVRDPPLKRSNPTAKIDLHIDGDLISGLLEGIHVVLREQMRSWVREGERNVLAGGSGMESVEKRSRGRSSG